MVEIVQWRGLDLGVSAFQEYWAIDLVAVGTGDTNVHEDRGLRVNRSSTDI